ncbi:hypothetical protein P22_3415 [Propionispora sp. 2/2-37]|uniref:N-acyl amino acid synthase FeeM domain-containing protein n=1 Tax=Propionispora sp. 2/2-37 TaxID=1677858 RepID=UPI0006BB98CA|nr:GNAT family N-acyltransferase [Propionispora sp. 2/2-37]CUH97288.1 hypothetical protein P22_3415 [Propionispora sp. 2/2-37]
MTNYDVKTSSEKDATQVFIATSLAEKKAIYHFRYQIYIEEMSKNIMDADYGRKLLQDELDEWAVLLYAQTGTEIIGTARINIGTLHTFPKIVTDYLFLSAFQNCPNETDQQFAFLTKLMVAPAYRSSPVLYLLVSKCYEYCCANQVQFGFGICNLHLARLYEQMGFHRYTKNYFFPGYGLQLPLVMLADDIQHFRNVRSPLYRIARKRSNLNNQAIEWFHNKFTRQSGVINSQLITEEDLWSILCERLRRSPKEAIALLGALSDAEAKKFLHSCSSYIHCAAGDLITTQGEISYTYNLLISGTLKSQTFQNPAKEYTLPGQHFGANGLTAQNKHTEDIVATKPSDILVLSGMAFQRFFHAYPEIAHKIVYHLTQLARNRLRQKK